MELGVVFEQTIEIIDNTGKPRLMRRVELHLDECTADGHTVIQMLTTVPAELLDARDLARLCLYPRSTESGDNCVD